MIKSGRARYGQRVSPCRLRGAKAWCPANPRPQARGGKSPISR